MQQEVQEWKTSKIGGSMLQEIRCPHCNEFICEASGEVKRNECNRCKKPIHVVSTNQGVFGMSEILALLPVQITYKKLTSKP